MTEERWYRPADKLPTDHQKVYWIRSDGEVEEGVYYRGLWFLGGDLGMYIYYTPIFWKSREGVVR